MFAVESVEVCGVKELKLEKWLNIALIKLIYHKRIKLIQDLSIKSPKNNSTQFNLTISS